MKFLKQQILFFIKNILNIKMLIGAVIVAAWCFLYVQDYITASLMTDNSLNVIEPAIYLLSNKSVSSFLFVLCFVFSFCDVPFEDGVLPYYVYRLGYKRWHGRILIFTALFCLLFILVPIFLSMIFSITGGFFSLKVWSSTAILTSNGGAPDLSFMPEFSPAIISFSPGKALLYSAVLTFLHYFSIGLVLLILNSLTKKTWGVLLVTALEAIGYILSMTYPKISKVFPFVNASFEENVFQFPKAFLGFFIACILLIIISRISIKKYRFELGEAK